MNKWRLYFTCPVIDDSEKIFDELSSGGRGYKWHKSLSDAEKEVEENNSQRGRLKIKAIVYTQELNHSE